MKVELVTQGDLENLKESLLEEIKKLLKPEKLVHKKMASQCRSEENPDAFSRFTSESPDQG